MGSTMRDDNPATNAEFKDLYTDPAQSKWHE